MITIHKYRYSTLAIAMPEGAKILHAAVQADDIFIWAMVNTDMPTVDRRFIIYGTGSEIMPEDVKFLTYINTLQIDTFVWHVFEVKE